MWLLTKFVDVSQCNVGALLPPAHVSQPTTTSTGTMAKHPLLKLQRFDDSGSLDTFLLKFQRMSAYLRWDNEDT